MEAVGAIVHYNPVRDAYVLLDIVLTRLNGTMAELHAQLCSCAIDPPRGKIRDMLLITMLGLVHRWWLTILVLLWLSVRVHRNILVGIPLGVWLL